jgi:hypothetical protein
MTIVVASPCFYFRWNVLRQSPTVSSAQTAVVQLEVWFGDHTLIEGERDGPQLTLP